MFTNRSSIPYKVQKIEISKDTQKEPWFRAINPNGRIPALTDSFTDGKTINLFESGSIMQYLVDRYDTDYKISYPRGTRESYEVNNWLFFQNAGVGPMQGQASECVFPHSDWDAICRGLRMRCTRFDLVKRCFIEPLVRRGVAITSQPRPQADSSEIFSSGHGSHGKDRASKSEDHEYGETWFTGAHESSFDASRIRSARILSAFG
jgi:hypothetical protein